MVQKTRALTDDFLTGVAGHAAKGIIDLPENPIGNDSDANRRRSQHSIKFGFTLLDGCLGIFTFGNIERRKDDALGEIA